MKPACGCTHGRVIERAETAPPRVPLLVRAGLRALEDLSDLSTLERALEHFSLEERVLFPLLTDQDTVQRLFHEHSVMLTQLMSGQPIDKDLLAAHEKSENELFTQLLARFGG